MANTKVTSRVLADDAVGLAQLNISNDPSNGQALTYVASSNDLQWATISGGVDGISTSADATAITINSSEQVGIGTTSPTKGNLVVSGAAYDSQLLIERTDTSSRWGLGGTTSGAFQIWDDNQSDASRFVINSSGHVGIGTTSPSQKLSVTSTDNTSSTNIARFAANNDTLAIGIGYETIRQTESAGVIKFETGGSERMKINSSGNVSIGTISPAAKFHVKGASGAVTGVIYAQQDTTGLSKPAIALSKYDNDNSTSQVYIMFGINQYNAGCGQINANGASQAAFGSFSDRRLKENISDLPSQLDNIVALEPKEFDYIESEGGGHQIGFVAQDVEEIYPDLVGEREDGMKTLTGIGKMEARLISAIKELKTELDAAKARIETLESN